jgi:hypothetical protein
MVIHVQDELGLASLPTGLDFRRTGVSDLDAAIRVIRKDSWHALVMAPIYEMPELNVKPTDRTVHVSGFYGAENAAMKSFDFTIDKRTLLPMFCEAKSIAL